MFEYRLPTLLNLTLRTFFVRLFYNYENLFGEGIFFCLKPFYLHHNTNSEKSGVLLNHKSLFNTNEYMSGFALGIIIHSESIDPDKSEKTKMIISSVLGSVGDTLVYRIILPVMVLFALNIFFISNANLPALAFFLIITELFLFNIFNFAIRFYGLKAGLRQGVASLQIFKSQKFFNLVKALKLTRNLLALSLVIILLTRINILLFF